MKKKKGRNWLRMKNQKGKEHSEPEGGATKGGQGRFTKFRVTPLFFETRRGNFVCLTR